jgi:hypothetical protein
LKPKKNLFASLIQNSTYWEKLEQLEFILRPTSIIVGILESDACCLSDIYKIFKALLIGYAGQEYILELVKDRWAFLHTESMGFAYFLDPKLKPGEGFIDDDMYDTMEALPEFIIRKNFCTEETEITAEITKFINDMKNPTVKAAKFINKSSALTYWYTMGASDYPILFKVAEIVFKVPTSQAAAERAWSIYDFILTKRRNRLGPEKVTQLVQLYMNADLKEHENNLIEVMMGLEEDGGDSDAELIELSD